MTSNLPPTNPTRDTAMAQGLREIFLRARARLGADISFRGPKRQALIVEAGCVRGVITNQGTITAPTVIVATGPWARPLIQQRRIRPADRMRISPGRNSSQCAGHERWRVRLHRLGHRHLFSFRLERQISDRRFLRQASGRSRSFSAKRFGRISGGDHRASLPPNSRNSKAPK